jgi:hypothetical protein
MCSPVSAGACNWLSVLLLPLLLFSLARCLDPLLALLLPVSPITMQLTTLQDLTCLGSSNS